MPGSSPRQISPRGPRLQRLAAAAHVHLLVFGAGVLCKLPSKGPQSAPNGNMGSRWLEGIFLGYSESSNSYTKATEDGVVAARSLYQRPIANQWSLERLSAIVATPLRGKPDREVRLAENGER